MSDQANTQPTESPTPGFKRRVRLELPQSFIDQFTKPERPTPPTFHTVTNPFHPDQPVTDTTHDGRCPTTEQ